MCETYNTNSKIKFKISMLKSILCNYSHVYILVKGNITVPSMTGEGAATINANKKVMLNVCHKQTA